MVGGLLFRLLLLAQPMPTLLAKLLDDDSFYYFSIVRNVAEGHGIVFNEGIPTNGFHPLYALMILPLFKLLLPLGQNVPVYASLILLSVCDMVTTYFLYKVVNRLTNETWGLVAAFIWAFNPWVAFTSLIGVEVPVQIMLISILIFSMLNVNSSPTKEPPLFLWGSLLALIFLARMDGVFLGVGIFWWIIRNSKRNQVIPRSLKLFGSSLILVLPWLLWGVFGVGSLLPVSGKATHLLRVVENTLPFWVAGSIYITGVYMLQLILPVVFHIPWSGIQVASMFALILGLFILKRKDVRPYLKKLDFLLISFSLYLICYWFVLLGIRRWYALYLCYFFIIWLSILGFEISKNFVWMRRPKHILIFLSIWFAVSGSIIYSQTGAQNHAVFMEMAFYINSNLNTSRVGAFNTGILQYYTLSEVINLDGVVNPEAFEAMKQGQTEEYMLSHVDYWMDPVIDVELKKLDFSKINLVSVENVTYYEFPKPYMYFQPREAKNEMVYGVFRVSAPA